MRWYGDGIQLYAPIDCVKLIVCCEHKIDRVQIHRVRLLVASTWYIVCYILLDNVPGSS